MVASSKLVAFRKVFSLYASYGFVHIVVRLLKMIVKRRRMMNMIEGIPRARYNDSFFGSVPDLVKNMHRRLDFFAEASSGLPISYNTLGPKFDPSVVEILVRDPAVIKHFLKDNFDNYSKPECDMFWDTLRLWLGQGIFVAPHGLGATDHGQNWLRQRKVASNIFNRGNFNENMNDVFVAKGRRMCELLRKPAADGVCVDMQAKFFQYTMDSIMQILFGERADTMGGEANQYATAYDTAHRCLIEYFLTSIPALSMLQLLPWPFGGINGLAHKMHRHAHPLYREFLAAYRTLDSESRRMIAACQTDAKVEERKDLLALFVQSDGRDQQSPKERVSLRTSPSKSKKKENDAQPISAPMTTEWLRDVVLNMVIAGRDTTACTLSWMFYILATNQEIQKKLQAEIDAKFVADRVPTIQSVSSSELPYLNGVIYETLRLYPPVPVDGKMAVNDDVLPDGTKIPEGTKMSFMVHAIGRDPNVYADPEVVKPERWIPFKEPSQYEFPVFQAGPRICLGMNMALFEAKIAALMILQQYSFEMAPGEAENITYLPTALTMSICNTKKEGTFDSHNLWLIPHLRENVYARVGA
jgi:cytochrome P450